MIYRLMLAISLVLAMGRIAGFHGQFFQAAAHLVVGGWIGAGIAGGGWRCYIPAIALTVVECAVFLSQISNH